MDNVWTLIYKPRGGRPSVCVRVRVCGTSQQGNRDTLPVPSGLVFNILVIVFKALNRFPGDVL